VRRYEQHPHDGVERGHDARRADAARAPADTLLDLQRSAGNHAVAGMLARDKDPKAPDNNNATSITTQLGELGVIPLDSASWDANGKDVHISFGQSPIVSDFMQAFRAGRPLNPAWVSTPAAKSTMTGALIAQAQLSGPSGGEDGRVNATINFEKVEHEFVKR
jgi:hypothetical protein